MSLLAYSITHHFPGFLCPRQLTLLCYLSLFVNSMLSAQNPPPFTLFTPALQHTVLNGGIVLHFKAACWPFTPPPTQMQIHSLLTTTTNLSRHCFPHARVWRPDVCVQRSARLQAYCNLPSARAPGRPGVKVPIVCTEAWQRWSPSRDCDCVCKNTAVVNSPTAAVGTSRRMCSRQRWPMCGVLGRARRSGKGEVTANVSGATP